MFSSEFTTSEWIDGGMCDGKYLVKIHKTWSIGLASDNEHNIPTGFELRAACGAKTQEARLEAEPYHVSYPEEFNHDRSTLVRCEKCWKP